MASVLVLLYQRTLNSNLPNVRSFLAAPSLRVLGDFSYSLYLLHAPLLLMAFALFTSYRVPIAIVMPIIYFVVVPAILGISYLFSIGSSGRMSSVVCIWSSVLGCMRVL